MLEVHGVDVLLGVQQQQASASHLASGGAGKLKHLKGVMEGSWRSAKGVREGEEGREERGECSAFSTKSLNLNWIV